MIVDVNPISVGLIHLLLCVGGGAFDAPSLYRIGSNQTRKVQRQFWKALKKSGVGGGINILKMP